MKLFNIAARNSSLYGMTVKQAKQTLAQRGVQISPDDWRTIYHLEVNHRFSNDVIIAVRTK